MRPHPPPHLPLIAAIILHRPLIRRSKLQIVPALASNALELVMTSMCEKAGAQAQGKKSRRVIASHLKEAVMQSDLLEFDILRNIVA